MCQHELSEEGLAFIATGGAFHSEAALPFVFNVLLKQPTFFGEADDARRLLGLCWHGVTLSSRARGTLALSVAVGTGVSPVRGVSNAGEGLGV